ncbi:Peptidase S10, serine carboxypeptidase [Dillenia turbinata]|uniref:Peptidase S10, serine carboxypeptidase n=1 Tax=Dillenia turbinata TaxID=194707 RepID=A0AAN8W3Z5_9MAGN
MEPKAIATNSKQIPEFKFKCSWVICSQFSLLLLLLISIAASSSSAVIKTLPGFAGELPFKLETGYVGVGDAEEVQLFYLFVRSQRTPERDPLLLWLTGGPGCSTFSAFFYESGTCFLFLNLLCPLHFSVSNYTGGIPPLFINPSTWTQYLNIIYLDSPVGAGFSYSKTQRGYIMDDYKAAAEVYTFIRKWMMDHPEFLMNQFYVGGDSYSGIIVPMVVQEIYNGNNLGFYPNFNLQGYVLGNPVTDYYIDHNARVPFAKRMTLVPDNLYKAAKKHCNGNYVYIDPSNAQCLSDVQAIEELVREINIYQILEPVCKTISPQGRKWGRRSLEEELDVDLNSLLQDDPAFWCRNYGYVLVGLWANNEQVRQALSVREGTKGYWKRCNFSMSYTENVRSSVSYHKNLTNTRLRALIFSGDHDMSVPHIATQTWIQSLNITVEYIWRAWYVDAQVAGYTEIYTNNDFEMTFATIKARNRGGGHIAPEYKPKQVYELLNRWFAYYPL